MNANFHTLLSLTSNAEMLNRITQLASIGDILWLQLSNAIGKYLFAIQRHSKGYRRENNQFMCRINSLNIKGWIGFCITLFLSFNQHIGKLTTFAVHL